MADLPSKTQLDKLGDRLRKGSRDEADIRAVDAYRHSFRPAFDVTMGELMELRRLEKTGRMKFANSAPLWRLGWRTSQPRLSGWRGAREATAR